MGHSCCENKSAELVKLRGRQQSVLKMVLLINAVMFLVEFTSGIIAKSSALTADSLDMLGDAIVYGFSLYVLYRSDRWKAKASFLKGIIIVGFASYVLVDTTLKVLSSTIPVAETMGIIGGLALLANVSCLLLLLRHRNDDINMKSTFVCSRNDIISNVGVLSAALFVQLMNSKWPDIVVGYLIAVLFFKSAWPILKESIEQLKTIEARVT